MFAEKCHPGVIAKILVTRPIDRSELHKGQLLGPVKHPTRYRPASAEILAILVSLGRRRGHAKVYFRSTKSVNGAGKPPENSFFLRMRRVRVLEGCERRKIDSTTRLITLRRDQLSPLQFIGQQIGAASRTRNFTCDPDETLTFVISASLYQTVRDNYVIGVDVFSQNEQRYVCRDGETSGTLQALIEELHTRRHSSADFSWLDDDILGELFGGTEIGDLFIEPVD
jgi:hypothetical protein